MAVPTSEPERLVAGESWQWDITDDEFPASTWTLVYDFLSHETTPVKITLTASANGDTHEIRETPAATGAFKARTYSWEASFTDGTDTFFKRVGTMEVVQDPGGGTVTDPRSWAKITLDNIEAVIQGKANKDQKRYRLGDVELQRMTFEELLEARANIKTAYEEELEQEEETQGKNKGKGFVSFTSR